MALDNEFLPMLNSWPLFCLVIALVLGYSFVEYIMPHIKERREARQQAKAK